MSTPLPPHLHGVAFRQSSISSTITIRPVTGSTRFTHTPMEQLWERLNEQDRHDLMMIALVDTADMGDSIARYIERGRFRLYSDGEIWGEYHE